MPSRPSMHARDSSGRPVSLLNDDPTIQNAALPFRTPNYPSYSQSSMMRSSSRDSMPSNMPSPLAPGLTRTDSFDSNIGPTSPLTPSFASDYGRQMPYASAYKDPTHYEYTRHDCPPQHAYGMMPRSQYAEHAERRTHSHPDNQMYDDDSYQNSSSSERGTKRYPCKYSQSHSCGKTFTTSGHASRHSKIHTAEKGVHCTYEGCPKKFTRADNMKQHLETHDKDKSRSKSSSSNSSNSSSSSSGGGGALTRPAGVRKNSSVSVSTTTSRPASRNATCSEQPPLDPALTSHTFQNQNQNQTSYHAVALSRHASPPSPTTHSPYGAMLPESSGPMVSHHLRGLDALAAAAGFTTQS